MSLVTQNILGRPTTPMLVLAGVLDTQVPISDIYLLLNKGDVPKDAWINPHGGHLGRLVKVCPDPVIFGQVIIPWPVRPFTETMPEAPLGAQFELPRRRMGRSLIELPNESVAPATPEMGLVMLV